MSESFYGDLMKNLRGQPILSAFVGIVFMFIVTGGGAFFSSKDARSSPYAGLIVAALFLGVLLIFLVLAGKLLDWTHSNAAGGMALAPLNPASSDPRIKAISKAVDQLKKIVEAEWIKSDLHFKIAISEIPGSTTSARLRLEASFKVANITDCTVQFPFITEVEVESTTADTLGGHLSIDNTKTGRRTHDKDIRLKKAAATIRRYQEGDTELDAGCSYEFKWNVDEYVVPLPYSEYWASAHPVFSVEVAVITASPDIRATAVIYRPHDQGSVIVPFAEGDELSWRANGVFLPYQGILLKVFRA